MNGKKRSVLLTAGIFIGIMIGLVISSNFDWVMHSVASDRAESAVALGSSEPVSQELMGLQSLSKAFTEVAKIASPAVVTINSSTVVKQSVRHPFMDDPFFRQFFDVPDQKRVMRGLGSGVIVNPDGYILTNNHVIKDADEITVMIDKVEHQAKVIGKDPASDIAVIKIDKKGLPTLNLGNSDRLEVGEWVMAIGNPFSDVLEKTVTAGIVSAKGRSLGAGLGEGSLRYQDFIQTDAAINPGNSGGALVNLRGELVGINTAIVGQSNVGIGFAIPINMARSIMSQLIADGRVRRGWIGVQLEEVDEEKAEYFGLDKPKGAQVGEVLKDSPAEKAGLKQDDIILKLNDIEVTSRDQLIAWVGSQAPSTRLNMTIWRDKALKTISLTLAERPSDEEVASEESGETSQANKLGIEVRELTRQLARQYGYEGESGVVIASVDPNSVADRKGLREGDLILSVNDATTASVRDFRTAVRTIKPGAVVYMRIMREQTVYTVGLRMPRE
ncbi:MAG TPA: Do family serine endopeptidase [bacterium]|nr:Do family serine endopeptidase [bacterium]HPM60731.1 Do family serine endopeptidase [bacterium]